MTDTVQWAYAFWKGGRGALEFLSAGGDVVEGRIQLKCWNLTAKIMGVQRTVTSKIRSQESEDEFGASGLGTASPERFIEMGTELLGKVVARLFAGGDCGFELDELKSVAWIRLCELSWKVDARPRTRRILELEIKKAIIKFIRREREHGKLCAGLFLNHAEGVLGYLAGASDEDEKRKPAIPETARFTHLHCAPYSFEDRLKDRHKRFSGLKTWNFSHLNSECEARKIGGTELIREELKQIIDSLAIVPFNVSAPAPGRRACCRAA